MVRRLEIAQAASTDPKSYSSTNRRGLADAGGGLGPIFAAREAEGTTILLTTPLHGRGRRTMPARRVHGTSASSWHYGHHPRNVRAGGRRKTLDDAFTYFTGSELAETGARVSSVTSLERVERPAAWLSPRRSASSSIPGPSPRASCASFATTDGIADRAVQPLLWLLVFRQ